ncbi:MAG: M48 family metallopeptidase [Rhodospirillales bacterium]|nr:M48 family metallopeptidase [Rhodospirillales bacterium]
MDRRTFVCGCGALLAGACAQAPMTGRSQLILVSDAEMTQAGAQAYKEALAKDGVSQDGALQQRVRAIGTRIANVSGITGAQWQFTVIDDQSANAFALPGGKVAVNTGLFKVAENDDQLATVLGHEIAHVAAHHAAERVSQQMVQQGGLQALGVATGNAMIVQAVAAAATVAITLPYSRTQESEADEIGLMFMARAGYDPRQAIDLWQNMQRAGSGGTVEFLSTHPSPGSRIERLQALMPQALQAYRAAGGKAA